MTPATYVVVSPVKDEAAYIELTLRSMVSQTHKPTCWVIVDDGSKDETAAIVRRYEALYPFIRLVTTPHTGMRQPGSAVIKAFNFGYQLVKGSDHDFMVKLDADLSFEPDYFERLLGHFLSDERLGIASGVYFEADGAGRWHPISMPEYHACGACKVVRRSCFEEIGGFLAARGWDTVDEIRAWSKGWRTRHLRELELKHHKREGTGIGQVRTNLMHGEIYYVTGGDPLFLVFKVLHRLRARPFIIGASALMWGYLSSFARRQARLVSADEARRYRQTLRRRLVGRTRMSVWPRSRLAER